MFSRLLLQVIILDVRVPCTPVARLNNHRACVNGIAWAPHSSCHICTAGTSFKLRLFVCLLLNGTSALFRPLVPRIVEIEHTNHVKNDLK